MVRFQVKKSDFSGKVRFSRRISRKFCSKIRNLGHLQVNTAKILALRVSIQILYSFVTMSVQSNKTNELVSLARVEIHFRHIFIDRYVMIGKGTCLFWKISNDFCSFLLGFGQILVRFLVKNGQIVGQIFPNFGQIIILTTLDAWILSTGPSLMKLTEKHCISS